MRVTKYLEI